MQSCAGCRDRRIHEWLHNGNESRFDYTTLKRLQDLAEPSRSTCSPSFASR